MGRPSDGAGSRIESSVLVGIVLLLTAVLAYLWLAARPLEIDEYLSYYTDSQATAAKVLWVQLHYPISLDPPTYHLLSHFAMDVVGKGAIGLRLPALAGFLLFQLCLFGFVKRLAGSRAAVIATALPFATFSFFYAQQGRPYGLLLGLYALAMLCWQAATRATTRRDKIVASVGLAVALVLGVTTHFFGVLILLPVGVGELIRWWRMRRVDWAIAATLAAGVLAVGIVVPFQRPAAVYRLHYYMTTVSWRMIPQAYAALFAAHYMITVHQQHVLVAVLAIATVLIAIGMARLWRHGEIPSHELAALAVLELLPFFGFFLGRFVTHTADVRYVIATLFANLAALCIVLQPVLRRTVVFYATLAAILAFGFKVDMDYVRGGRQFQRAVQMRFDHPPAVAAELAKDPTRPIYIQSLSDFFFNSYYEPDPALRARMTLVYSDEKEMGWLGHDTNYLTAVNMTHFTQLPIVEYRIALEDPGRHQLVLNYPSDGWDWLGKDLAARRVGQRPIGSMTGGGELEELTGTGKPVSAASAAPVASKGAAE